MKIKLLVAVTVLLVSGCSSSNGPIAPESCGRKEKEYDEALCLIEAGLEDRGFDLLLSAARNGDQKAISILTDEDLVTTDEEILRFRENYKASRTTN